MHVHELIDVLVVVDLGPGRAQLLQRIGPKGAEREKPGRLEHTPRFGEGRVEIAPLQHEAAEDHVHTRVSERQTARVCAHALEAMEQALMTTGFLQHSRGQVQSDHQRAAVLAFQQRRGSPRPGAQVEHRVRSELECIEAIQQLVRHSRLQNGRRFVVGARAIE